MKADSDGVQWENEFGNKRQRVFPEKICFNNCEPGNVFDAMRGGTTHTFDCGSRIFNKKYELKDTCRRKEARNWNIYIHVSFLQGAACARCDGSDVT